MKKAGFFVFSLILSVAVYGIAYACGQMFAVYKTGADTVSYGTAVVESSEDYISGRQSVTSGYSKDFSYSHVPDDDEIQDEQADEYEKDSEIVWWHNSFGKTMRSFDDKIINVNIEDIEVYESIGWFGEQPVLMSKEDETKYVVKSDVQSCREDGWMVEDFTELDELEEEIKDYISNKRGKYGIYIKNLDTDESLVMNDGQYSAASIIKLFVMAGVYNEAGEDRLNLDSSVKSKLNTMITVSDNYSSNFLVGRMGHGNYSAGFDAENKNSKSLGCVLTQHKSLFSGCGDYVSYGRNFVSPYDCGIVLEKIYNSTLVNQKYSAQMLSMLKNQERRNKIPAGLPKGTECANKTGEASGIESDVAIVYSPNCDYIICVITNGAANGANDITKISQITYNYFNK